VPIVEADQPLADVAASIAQGWLTLVVDNGILVGVLSTDDLTHASEIARLSLPRPEPS
jgi:hypothetical protein